MTDVTNQMRIQLINEEYKGLLIKDIICSCLNSSSNEYRLHFDRSIFHILNQHLHSMVESIHTFIEQIQLKTNNKIHCKNTLQRLIK